MIRELQAAVFEATCDGLCGRSERLEGNAPPAWLRFHLQGQIATKSGSMPFNVTVCSSDCASKAIAVQLTELMKALLKQGTPP